MSLVNHYEVLGVPETATTEQIKLAFRAVAKTCHPQSDHR